MENCSSKTEMLRERYKEYLKPIDPLHPLGRDPTELMPPPDRTVQTCFALKEKFPRGEVLIRTLAKPSVLDKLDEYSRLQIPAQCPCENVVQGADPARKKRRFSICKTEPSKNDQQHVLCPVMNLPQAYIAGESDNPPQAKDIPSQGNTRAKLRTCTPMWDIKKDKNMNDQAITSQRKLIREKAVEIQKKSLALQQTSNSVCKKTELKKSMAHTKDADLCVRSKPTAPRKPVVPPKQHRSTISLPFDDMAIKGQQLEMALLADSFTSSHEDQPMPAISSATSGASASVQLVQHTKNALLDATTSKRTRPCRPVVPAMRKPKALEELLGMPTLGDPREMSRPTSPATTIVGNASNETNDLSESSESDMEATFYPDPPQPNVDSPKRTSPGNRIILENQQKCEPMTIHGSKEDDVARGDMLQPMSSSLRQANLTIEEESSKTPSSLYEPESIRAATPVFPLNQDMPESSSTKINDSLLGMVSKPTHPRKPALPPRKPSSTPAMGDSLFGITSKPTNPRRPTVPPRKQQSGGGIIELPPQKPAHRQNKVTKPNMTLQTLLPNLGCFR